MGRTEIVRRYREKCRANHNKHEQMKQKDRQRKQEARRRNREQLLRNPQELKDARERKKIEMRAYREKKKMEKKSEITANEEQEKEEIPPDEKRRIAAKKSANRRKEKQKKQRAKEKKNQIIHKKKLAVLRTQQWRLRVKLAAVTSPAQVVFSNPDDGASPSLAEISECPGTSTASATKTTPVMTRWSEQRLLKKARDSLPTTPQRRARIVRKLIESPKTGAILNHEGIINTEENRSKALMSSSLLNSLREAIKITKPSGTAPHDKKVAYSTIRSTAALICGSVRSYKRYVKRSWLTKHLGIKRRKDDSVRWWNEKVRQRRKDRLSGDTRQKVENFYLLPEVSRELPSKNDVMRIKGTGSVDVQVIQKHVMTMTLRAAFDMFKSPHYHEGVKIGFSSFCGLKPPQVKKISETNRRTCLCQICCNVALKAEALKNFIQGVSSTADENLKQVVSALKFRKRDLADLTLCNHDDAENPKAECLQRRCTECGPQNITTYFQPLLDMRLVSQIKWCKWEYITIIKKGKNQRCLSCVAKETNLQVFMDDLVKAMVTYPGHIFRANWQHKQLGNCLDQLENDEALMVMDFAENYNCSFQDECQSAFFDQRQVTVHPIMLYYKVPDEGSPEKMMLMKHAIIAISDDLRHDAMAVKQFENEAFGKLLAVKPHTKMIYQFSDGSSSQYKGKNGFAILSFRSGLPHVTRNFFETSHGKSVCDGLGAIVKSSAYQAVVSGRRLITSAKELYYHCEQVLHHGPQSVKNQSGQLSQRDFVYIAEEAIDHEESDVINSTTLIGTQRLHVIRGTGMPYQLESRNLSCYCNYCKTGLGECPNISYVEDWRISNIGTTAKKENSKADVADSPKASSSKSNNRTSCTKSKSKDSMCHADDTATTTSLETTNMTRDLQVDDFVALFLQIGSKRRPKKQLFMAQVRNFIDVDTVEVKFMESCKFDRMLYKWPVVEDISWESTSQILLICKPPVFSEKSSKRHQLYKFDDDEIECADKLCMK